MRRWLWGVWISVAGWVLVVVVAHHPQRGGPGWPWHKAGVLGLVLVPLGWLVFGAWAAWSRRRAR